VTTYFTDRIFTPLDRAEAKAVVEEIEALLEARVSTYDGPIDLEPPKDLPGLTVMTLQNLRESEEEGVADVFEDLSIEVEAEPPPTADQARARAAATGYAEWSRVLEPDALARLATCRSTIQLHYPARLFEKKPFVALCKRILERVGSAAVESADGSRLETTESFATEAAKQLGSVWTKTAPLAPPHAHAEKKPRKTRSAKPGEVEAVALYDRLMAILDGADPFVRETLKEALEDATEPVRQYAAALLEEGANADATLAKALGWKAPEATEAREALAELVEEVEEEEDA
jgi:hypothetical protein